MGQGLQTEWLGPRHWRFSLQSGLRGVSQTCIHREGVIESGGLTAGYDTITG